MNMTSKTLTSLTTDYLKRLNSCFDSEVSEGIDKLAVELLRSWTEGRQVYICGNGGSAANSVHIANDFHYGIGACGAGPKMPGLKVEALPSNTGIVTCLANDTGYENIYSHQLEVKGKPGDVLIALSGSGNSENIVRAIEYANRLGMATFAILAFDGGRCKAFAQTSIHFKINDMQIAEDTQLIVGHICMQWLSSNKPHGLSPLTQE